MTERIEILKQRALKLAVLEKPEQVKNYLNVTKFVLEEEVYCFDTKYLKEIVKKHTITSVPSIPDFILGIIVLRGKVYCVNDLNKILKSSRSLELKTDIIIITEYENLNVGFVCDDILGEFLADESSLCKSVQALKIEKKEFVKGVFSDGVIYLDLEKILKDENLIIK